MTRKAIIVTILALVLGVALGVGGILGYQAVFQSAGDKAQKAATTSRKVGPLVSIGEFTVNLQGGSFLKTAITLEGKDTKSEATLKSRDAFLKDRVNTVLANKSLSDVQTAEAREKLRKELLQKLNEVAEDQVQDVLFTIFVYQ